MLTGITDDTFSTPMNTKSHQRDVTVIHVLHYIHRKGERQNKKEEKKKEKKILSSNSLNKSTNM